VEEKFSNIIDRLRDSASKDPCEFAKHLQPLLTANFEATFQYVKTQKLLLKQRSSAWILGLERELLDWLPRAPLKGKQKAQVTRHLTVCKAIQELLEIIDKRSEALCIWQASTEDLLRSLFSWVETHHIEQETDEAKRGLDSQDAIAGLRHMELRSQELRFHCDYVTRIVNQISQLGIKADGRIQPSASDIEAAVLLAAQADIVLHVLDCYTYKKFRVSVEAKHLFMHGLKSQIEEAMAWSSLRAGSSRLMDVSSMPRRIKEIEELAAGLSCDSETFQHFLNSDVGSQVSQALHPSRLQFARILKHDVSALIDLDFAVTTKAGTFSTRELLECWSLFDQIAVSAHVWRRVFQRSAPCVLPVHQLETLVASSLGCSSDQAVRLISQFSLNPAQRNQDPFFRPLIKLNESERLVAATFIETGRFSRNLFTIAIREGRVDFSAKGLKPLQTLRRQFLNAGYQALLNVPIATSDGLVTDADIVSTRDGYLFVGQTKVLINPDTLYDGWKALENLKKAASQLKKTLFHISLVAERFGLVEAEFLVVPFLLTNVWDFTGATIEGFKVVDFSYLSLLLGGGEIWRVTAGPTPTRELDHKLIRGRHPTGEELSKLLLKPFHETMFRKPKLGQRDFTVGDWTITVPVDLSKFPEDIKPSSPKIPRI
jgi:hypothetical protein